MRELKVTNRDEGGFDLVPMAEFLDANIDDVETCESVKALNRGGQFWVGGGASPCFIIERIS